MSYVRYIMFKLEKGMVYINRKFWGLMIIVNKFMNGEMFQFILYMLAFAAVGCLFYGLYRGLS